MTSSGLAVVTGASSGIGAELALLFAADGFDLLLTAEDGPGGDGLEPVAVRCRTAGVEVQTFRADLRAPDGVQALYEAADEDSATGGPDAVRGIYPTVATITETGFTMVEEPEVAERFAALIARMTERGARRSRA